MSAAAAPAPVARVGVAVSGGRDSTALWHATARAARAGDFEVVGMHVHHGLQPEAEAWLARLRSQARRWAVRGLPVRLVWRRLEGRPARGESLEAWARRERYAALSEMARGEGIDLVLLAHHRRDQAETFLLQALRGAGPAGLASMPRLAQRGGISWARPWLDQPRERVEAYLKRFGLTHVEDPSNTDRRRARNSLRRDVWPAWATAMPQAEAGVALAARRAQEAAACLRELAALDRQQVCDAAGTLDVAAWLRLSRHRRANLLRAWLAEVAGGPTPETLIERLNEELPHAAQGTWPVHGDWLRVHAGRLRLVRGATPHDSRPPENLQIDLDRCGRHDVPSWGGAFEVSDARRGGIAVAHLRGASLRARHGGEQFQRTAAGTPRALKKAYQSAGVPQWERIGPLVFAGETLLYVPGLGVDARRVGAEGTPMRVLHWVPNAAGPS